MIILVTLMLGGLYFGICSPSEAGAVGALSVLIISLAMRKFNLTSLRNSVKNTARLSSSLFFMLVIAMLFGKLMTVSGIQTIIQGVISDLNVSPMAVIVACLGVYFVLGTFMDAISQMALTLPIFFPLLTGMGMVSGLASFL